MVFPNILNICVPLSRLKCQFMLSWVEIGEKPGNEAKVTVLGVRLGANYRPRKINMRVKRHTIG